MIKDLENVFKQFLIDQATALGFSELANSTKTFSVPDAAWRGQGSGLNLDIYLYKILENRELYSNTWVRDFETRVPPPRRLECFFVISAWNKSMQPDFTGGNELLEHDLLSQVLFVLWRNPVLPASYVAGNNWLNGTQFVEIPIVASQSEDIPELADYWSSLDTFVRPSVHCKLTVSLAVSREVTGPLVTAMNVAIPPDTPLHSIGGACLSSGAPNGAPIQGASIFLNELGRMFTQRDGGLHQIDGIPPGSYHATGLAPGFQSAQVAFQLPGATLVKIVLQPL